jgi:hypothetical protein
LTNGRLRSSFRKATATDLLKNLRIRLTKIKTVISLRGSYLQSLPRWKGVNTRLSLSPKKFKNKIIYTPKHKTRAVQVLQKEIPLGTL